MFGSILKPIIQFFAETYGITAEASVDANDVAKDFIFRFPFRGPLVDQVLVLDFRG